MLYNFTVKEFSSTTILQDAKSNYKRIYQQNAMQFQNVVMQYMLIKQVSMFNIYCRDTRDSETLLFLIMETASLIGLHSPKIIISCKGGSSRARHHQECAATQRSSSQPATEIHHPTTWQKICISYANTVD